jgi:hypothetical protein
VGDELYAWHVSLPHCRLLPAPLAVQFGRNFYSRYDYEGVESEAANKMMQHLEGVISSASKGAQACPRPCPVYTPCARFKLG